jgi:hypothetical protein
VGTSDIFVSKLTSAGAFAWVEVMGGNLGDEGRGIALDGTGRTYVTGLFRNTVDFDPGAGTAMRTSAGFTDAFVLQLTEPGPLVYTVPNTNSWHFLTLRRNGAHLELIESTSGILLARRLLAETTAVVINGAVNEFDQLTIDYGFGGDFSLAGGVRFHGGAGTSNNLQLVGNTSFNYQAYRSTGLTSGEITLARGLFAPSQPSIVFTDVASVWDTATLVSFVTPLATIAPLLVINGTNAADTISISENGNNTFSVTANTFAGVTFANKTNLVLQALGGEDSIGANLNQATTSNVSLNVTIDAGADNDTIRVTSTGANTPLSINAGAGDDDIYMALGQIQGAVTVNGGGHAAMGDDLSISDSRTVAGLRYELSATRVLATNAGIITYTNIESLDLSSSWGDDWFIVQSLPASTAVTIDGGGGDNALFGADTDNVWKIAGLGHGTLNGTLQFRAIQNLIGGAGRDRFMFEDGAYLSGGWIDGGSLGGPGFGADDSLDYSLWTIAVNVHLEFGLATGIGSAVNIEHVFGGQGGDSLIGSAADNILVGGPGEDMLFGGLGRDLLIGGLDRDDLNGWEGEDLLIGGYTIYDPDPAALMAIMAEWRGPGGYYTRVDNLRRGISGGYILDSGTTVLDDNAPDTMTGDLQADWFWANVAGPVIDNMTDHEFWESLND